VEIRVKHSFFRSIFFHPYSGLGPRIVLRRISNIMLENVITSIIRDCRYNDQSRYQLEYVEFTRGGNISKGIRCQNSYKQNSRKKETRLPIFCHKLHNEIEDSREKHGKHSFELSKDILFQKVEKYPCVKYSRHNYF